MTEGTALIAPSALEVKGTPVCLDCDWDNVARVRFFLIVYRQARLYGEPFADVLRHRTRYSRSIDQSVRGKGFDWDTARTIGYSLDQLATRLGLGFMHADNAEAVSRSLCPSRTVDQ